jgi:hypothetical protein
MQDDSLVDGGRMTTKVTHLLLKNSRTSRRVSRDLSPPGCRYDLAVGAWIVNGSGDLLVETKEGPRPHTKKNDVETGEDQKGE